MWHKYIHTKNVYSQVYSITFTPIIFEKEKKNWFDLCVVFLRAYNRFETSPSGFQVNVRIRVKCLEVKRWLAVRFCFSSNSFRWNEVFLYVRVCRVHVKNCKKKTPAHNTYKSGMLKGSIVIGKKKSEKVKRKRRDATRVRILNIRTRRVLWYGSVMKVVRLRCAFSVSCWVKFEIFDTVIFIDFVINGV